MATFLGRMMALISLYTFWVPSEVGSWMVVVC